jgi:hypothetical protein
MTPVGFGCPWFVFYMGSRDLEHFYLVGQDLSWQSRQDKSWPTRVGHVKDKNALALPIKNMRERRFPDSKRSLIRAFAASCTSN